MRIESATIFKFYFGYEGTELMIPLAAATPEEAQVKLRDLFLNWANELQAPASMLSPVQMKGVNTDAAFAGKPPESLTPIADPLILQLRIEEMVRDLVPLKKPKGATAIDKLVKDWTGFVLEPQNYPSIIAELSRLKINDQGN